MKFTVRDIVEGALLVALAVVLGFIEIPLPLGGVSLALVPLFIIALRNGPVKTFIFVGVIYGLIDCLLDGYGIITFPLEYMIALGSTFIVSLAREELFGGEKNALKELVLLTLFVLSVTLVRFVCFTIDGMLIWKATLVESIVANAPNAFLDGGFTLVVLLLIYLPLRPLNAKKYLESK